MLQLALLQGTSKPAQPMEAKLSASGGALRLLMKVLRRVACPVAARANTFHCNNFPMKNLTNRSKQTKKPIINRERQCWASIIDAPKAYKRASNDTLLKTAICKVL